MESGPGRWPNGWVRRVKWISALCCVACLVTPLTARAMTAEPAAPRDGDNTIYLKWSAARKEAVTVTSSQRLVAGQRSSLSTSMSDRTGRLKMIARFKNMSESTRLSLEGTLVHVVMDDEGDVIKTFEEPVNVVLDPGERARAAFSYSLGSGWYSMTTNYRR